MHECARNYGNDSEAARVPNAVDETSAPTSPEEDRIFGRRQELERGENIAFAASFL